VDKWLKQYRIYIVLFLGLLAIMAMLLFWISRPQRAPIIISTPIPTATPTAAPTPTPSPLRIYVSGAVSHPDVYLLGPGSIVKDALQAAGGTTAEADLDRINLAIELHDQQQIYVPRQGETEIPVVSAPQEPTSAPTLSKININIASVDELDALPGIGPAIAGRIVEYRTANGLFAVVEDIMKVKGIGPNTFAKLQNAITTD